MTARGMPLVFPSPSLCPPQPPAPSPTTPRPPARSAVGGFSLHQLSYTSLQRRGSRYRSLRTRGTPRYVDTEARTDRVYVVYVSKRGVRTYDTELGGVHDSSTAVQALCLSFRGFLSPVHRSSAVRGSALGLVGAWPRVRSAQHCKRGRWRREEKRKALRGSHKRATTSCPVVPSGLAASSTTRCKEHEEVDHPPLEAGSRFD